MESIPLTVGNRMSASPVAMPVTEALQSPPSGLLSPAQGGECPGEAGYSKAPMKLHRHARPDVGVSSAAAPSADSSKRERLRAVPDGETYLYHAGARKSSGANGGGRCHSDTDRVGCACRHRHGVSSAGRTLAACLSIQPCSCQGGLSGLSGLVGLPELVRGRAGWLASVAHKHRLRGPRFAGTPVPRRRAALPGISRH